MGTVIGAHGIAIVPVYRLLDTISFPEVKILPLIPKAEGK